MRLIIYLIVLIMSVTACSNTNLTTKQLREQILKGVVLTRNSSVIIKGKEKVIVIDPYEIKDDKLKADYIFISHIHGDHMSLEDIKKMLKANTKVIATSDVIKEVTSNFNGQTVTVVPNNLYKIDGLSFKTVSAYNTNKMRQDFHPKNKGWVGYIIDLDGVSYYHAGDTQKIKEMKDLVCDVMFTPIGNKYTMNNVDEAVAAVLSTKARIAIPMHYDLSEGNVEEADRFVKLLSGKRESFRLK